MKIPNRPSTRKIFSIILLFVPIFFVSTFTMPGQEEPSGYPELYDWEKEGTEYSYVWKTCYLRWHGNKTELKIVEMHSMKGGRQWNMTVEDGDNFTVTIQKNTGWVEFYYDDKFMVLYRWGKLEEISPSQEFKE